MLFHKLFPSHAWFEGEGGTDPDPKGGATDPDPKGGATDPDPKGGTDKDAEALRAQLSRARNEAAEARKKNKEYEDKEAERERKKAEEDKDFQKQIDLERKAREKAETESKDKSAKADARIIKTEMKSLAREAGLIDVDLISMIDLTNVTVGEDGEVIGAEDAIEAFKKAKPKLFGAKEEGEVEDKGQRGQRQTPPRGGTPTGKVDNSKLPQAEFDAKWNGTNGNSRFISSR